MSKALTKTGDITLNKYYKILNEQFESYLEKRNVEIEKFDPNYKKMLRIFEKFVEKKISLAAIASVDIPGMINTMNESKLKDVCFCLEIYFQDEMELFENHTTSKVKSYKNDYTVVDNDDIIIRHVEVSKTIAFGVDHVFIYLKKVERPWNLHESHHFDHVSISTKTSNAIRKTI